MCTCRPGAEVGKFKMMMMGDLSAGKSDMMARYFGQDNHSIFAELTAKGMVQEERALTISGRRIKACCVDTSTTADNVQFVKNLTKGQRGVVAVYNPFREDSWQYLKQQMQPLLDGDKDVGKAADKFVIVCGHFIVGQQSGVQNVDEREVIEYCDKHGFFHVRVDGQSNRGLKEAFEYGPYCYIMKKENNIESLIFKQMQRMKEITDQRHSRAVSKADAKSRGQQAKLDALEAELATQRAEIRELQEQLTLAAEVRASLEAEKEKLAKWKLDSLTRNAKDLPAGGAGFAEMNRHLEINDPQFNRVLDILDNFMKVPHPNKSGQCQLLLNLI